MVKLLLVGLCLLAIGYALPGELHRLLINTSQMIRKFDRLPRDESVSREYQKALTKQLLQVHEYTVRGFSNLDPNSPFAMDHSMGGSYWHDAYAQAVAEVLKEGKLTTASARRVYLAVLNVRLQQMLIKLYERIYKPKPGDDLDKLNQMLEQVSSIAQEFRGAENQEPSEKMQQDAEQILGQLEPMFATSKSLLARIFGRIFG